MPGFASYDQIIEAITVNNRMQKLIFQKIANATTAANRAKSMWRANGIPASGGSPSVGTGNAAVCTSATTGAMPFTNASGGRTMHLLNATALSVNFGCTILLADRLAHVNLDRNQATAAISPALDGTSRLATGEGGMLLMEVTTAFGSGATTRTFTYTDQDGNSATTPNVTDIASAPIDDVPYATANLSIFIPLAAGDKGVRTVTNTTLGATGTATGAYNLVLIRPLGWITIPGQNYVGEEDWILRLPSLPRIYDSSCLQLFLVSSGTVTDFCLIGEVRIAEN